LRIVLASRSNADTGGGRHWPRPRRRPPVGTSARRRRRRRKERAWARQHVHRMVAAAIRPRRYSQGDAVAGFRGQRLTTCQGAFDHWRMSREAVPHQRNSVMATRRGVIAYLVIAF